MRALLGEVHNSRLQFKILLLQVVDISQEQMAALCGNVLELEDGRGLPVLAMSSQVFQCSFLGFCLCPAWPRAPSISSTQKSGQDQGHRLGYILPR